MQFQKIKDAIQLHNTDRCSIGPPIGVGDLTLELLSGTKDVSAAASSTQSYLCVSISILIACIRATTKAIYDGFYVWSLSLFGCYVHFAPLQLMMQLYAPFFDTIDTCSLCGIIQCNFVHYVEHLIQNHYLSFMILLNLGSCYSDTLVGVMYSRLETKLEGLMNLYNQLVTSLGMKYTKSQIDYLMQWIRRIKEKRKEKSEVEERRQGRRQLMERERERERKE